MYSCYEASLARKKWKDRRVCWGNKGYVWGLQGTISFKEAANTMTHRATVNKTIDDKLGEEKDNLLNSYQCATHPLDFLTKSIQSYFDYCNVICLNPISAQVKKLQKQSLPFCSNRKPCQPLRAFIQKKTVFSYW